MPNWMAERGGFEPPVPRDVLPAQMVPGTGANYAVPKRQFSAPKFRQPWLTSAPRSPQNFLPAGLSEPQITEPRFGRTTTCGGAGQR
jgi:hypothetical protein